MKGFYYLYAPSRNPLHPSLARASRGSLLLQSPGFQKRKDIYVFGIPFDSFSLSWHHNNIPCFNRGYYYDAVFLN